jgi:hypothetical protein
MPDSKEEAVVLDHLNAAVQPEADRQRLNRVFKFGEEHLLLFGEEHLLLVETRLKTSSKVDFAQRLTLLFLYAHEADGRDRVPRAALTKILSDARTYDGNTRGWLSRSPDLVRDGETFSLNNSGRDRAIQILNQVLDPGATDGWAPGSTPSGHRTRHKATRDETQDERSKPGHRKTAKGTSRSSPVSAWVTAWKGRALAIDAFSIFANLSAADKGLFALWAIRTTSGDDAKLVSPYHLERFLYQAFEIVVDDRALDRALAAEAAETKRVLRREEPGVKYQITPDGIQYVEGRAGISASTVSTSSSSNGAASVAP